MKNKVLSIILAAAMIFAVAAIASSCEKNNNPGGVIVDLPTGEATTTSQPAATTAGTTAATTPASTSGEPTPTQPTEITTTPSETTAETVASTSGTTATTEATTATTADTTPVTPPVEDPNTYTVDSEYGALRVKIEYIDPLPSPSRRAPNWKDVNGLNLRQSCDLIAKAVIVNMQEVCFNITIVDSSVQTPPVYGTILTLDLEQSHYFKDNPPIGTVKVFCQLSTHDTTTDAANLYIGGEYYFFLEKVDGNPKNILEYERVCDYFITLPPNMYYLPKTNELLSEKMIMLLESNAHSSSVSISPSSNLGAVIEEILG